MRDHWFGQKIKQQHQGGESVRGKNKDNEIKINLTMQVQIICQAQLALGESRSHSNSMTKETMATLVETCK
jgi:hypothetical protein